MCQLNHFFVLYMILKGRCCSIHQTTRVIAKLTCLDRLVRARSPFTRVRLAPRPLSLIGSIAPDLVLEGGADIELHILTCVVHTLLISTPIPVDSLIDPLSTINAQR